VGVGLPNPLLDVPSMPADLARVEASLHAAVQADDPFLTEIAAHLLGAGGKRVRPTFTLASSLLASSVGGPASEAAVQGATAVELVHLGSLYHDDVMDEAATRRGVQSVNDRWGNLRAILAGDFLLAKASELAAGLGTEVAGLLAATIGRLCEGQVRELQSTYDSGRTEAAYFASIEGKTASLLAAACRIGGIVGDLPRDHIDRLTQFGLSYGLAFQVVDDVLDVIATDEQLGKPAGNDLVEGVYTLPVIRAVAAGGAPAAERVLGRRPTPDEVAAALLAIRASDAVGSALDTARDHAASAVGQLDGLAGTPAADGLVAAASHLLASVESLAA
jgi:heptaprenyl diphosphate synthase